jgi:hypothetical protein
MAGTRDLLLRRRAAGAATAVSALALLAGCGNNPNSKIGTFTNTITSSSTLKARGPSDLGANLAWLAKKSYTYLDDFKAACPEETTPPTYPVQCSVTAIDTSRPDDPKLRPDGFHRPVSGTATVYGVYPSTRTYVFSLHYEATRSTK